MWARGQAITVMLRQWNLHASWFLTPLDRGRHGSCSDLSGAKIYISASSASASDPPHPLHLTAQMSLMRVQAGHTTSNVSSSSASKTFGFTLVSILLPTCTSSWSEDSFPLQSLAVSSWSNLEAAAATSHSAPPPTVPRDGGGRVAAVVPPSKRSSLAGGARRVALRSRCNDSNEGIVVCSSGDGSVASSPRPTLAPATTLLTAFVSGESVAVSSGLADLLTSRNVEAVGDEQPSVFGCGGSLRRFPELGRIFGTGAARVSAFLVLEDSFALPPPPPPLLLLLPVAVAAGSLLSSTLLRFGPVLTATLTLLALLVVCVLFTAATCLRATLPRCLD